jgi:hypothetical protein
MEITHFKNKTEVAKTGAFGTATIAEAAMPFGKQAFNSGRPILSPETLGAFRCRRGALT